jgi:DNA-binding transcriptional regulator YiaG
LRCRSASSYPGSVEENAPESRSATFLPNAQSRKQIRKIKEKANLSQAAFARCPNLTVGYFSRLERGTKQPKRPALALLNVIRRKGPEAIL